MKPKTPPHSPALAHVLHVWDHVSRSSWQRLNGALYSALSNAIRSGMDFDDGDLRYLSENCRCGYWLGDGERLYSAACGGSRGDFNLSAAIAFEKHWGRPAWLWPEETKTPKRLHIGERFHWQGRFVTVTSFNDAKKSLVACTYKDNGERGEDWQIGRTIYITGEYRRLETFKQYDDGSIAMRVSAKVDYESSTIAKRFTITHDELMKVRKEADAKVRDRLKQIKAAETLEALEQVGSAIAAEGTGAFRHFDVEQIQSAFHAHKEAVQETMSRQEQAAYHAKMDATHAADLQRWKNGEQVNRMFNSVSLRVKGDSVETSTGQHASLSGSRVALKFAQKHRKNGWQPNGSSFDLDQFPVKRITPDGVTVGCTYIPWTEIDRIAKQIK